MSFLNNKDKLIKFVITFLVISLSYFILNYIGGLILPFIIGYILCVILYPLFKLFNIKYKIPKHLSSILCIILFILLIIIFFTGIVLQIIREGEEVFSKELPYLIENLKNLFDTINYKIENMIKILPNSLENILLDFFKKSSFVISEFLGNGLKSTSIKVIKKVPNALMTTVISIISCYLMLIDKENIEKFILNLFPKKIKQNLNIVKSTIMGVTMGYIKAQLIIMCLISSICFIGLVILKAKYTLFIAVLIGVIDALPVFGSGFILWPLALYNVINKNYYMSIGFMVIYLVILLTRQFIEPKILGKQIGIHPLATLMSIYIGIQVFGVFGFIIGPIIVVILKALQNENVLPKL